MRNVSIALATMLAGAFFAGPADAFVNVVGGSLATACFDNARVQARTAEAVDQCTNALAETLSRHDRAGTYVNRGIVYMNRGAYARALADFDMAISLMPDLAEGHLNRGAALLARDDFAGAIASIDRGLGLGPEEPARAYYNRGIAHEELGDVRAAYRDYVQAANLAPAWERPRAELARFRVG